ncbi:hypothetical protein [Thermanaeromonas sp. C210]|uniref:hypothetical protein n=1 Tax=Thermanaeromonas sp. C210 TaxID=2731925 RepID=UPI00155B7998|nr:hypothetical protein [Thermanaeromonas sp. C210]GFN23770.1 hypothetical protein TAMC210_20870 [Thermanaeromonas sp. C210]
MGYKRIVIAGSRSAVGKTSIATILGKRGDTVRGHEFHYSSLTGTDDDFPYAYTWQVGQKLYRDGYTAQGYWLQ